MGVFVMSRLSGVLGDINVMPSSEVSLINNVPVVGATQVLLEMPTIGGRGEVAESVPTGVVMPLVGGVLLLPRYVPRLFTAASVQVLSFGLLLLVAVYEDVVLLLLLLLL